jgi:serine/threonine-protein kinase ATR
MDRVAPFVVNRLCTEPTLWQEFCKLMVVSPKVFFTISQSITIPDLLVRCDAQGLDIVSKFLEHERHSLIVGENMHLHLAPIFLLKSPSATTKSINFILGILNEASDQKIDLRHVLPGCTTALLTELVVMMGDENPEVNALVGVYPIYLNQASSHRNALGYNRYSKSGDRHQDRSLAA